jgi:PAS domain S-box-containing protein
MNIPGFVRSLGRLLPRSRPIHAPAVESSDGTPPDAAMADWFHLLLDALPYMVGFFDLQGRVLRMNVHAARLLGFGSADELLANTETSLDLVAPSDRERASMELPAFLQRGSMGPFEVELVRRDGTVFPAEIDAAVVRDPSGRAVGILGLARDITARQQTQTMLREYAERLSILAPTVAELANAATPETAYSMLARRLQDLTEALMVGVSTYDPATNTVTIRVISDWDRHQPLLERLIGGNPLNIPLPLTEDARQQVRTGRLHDVPGFHALMFQRIPEQVAKTVEQVLGIGQIHSIGLVKDEQILGLASILMPRGRAIIFPEIVETLVRQSTSQLLRQSAEQSLRESEERFRNLFHEIGDAFILLDAALCVVDYHDTPLGLLGFCREDVMGRALDASLPNLIRGEPTLMEDLQGVLQMGASRSYARLRYAMDEGAKPVVYLDLTAYAVRIGGRPHVALLCRDVSTRVSLEAELQQAQRQATFARMASGVAHDLGGLLAIIRASAEFVAGSLPEGSPEREQADHIQDAVERGDALRRQMLGISRTGSAPFEIIDLNHVIQDALGLLRALVGSGIHLEFRPDVRPIYLWGDQGHIVRILMNLADNARDAMPQGGSIIIETRAEQLEAERAQAWDMEAGTCALLTVRDTGAGMSQETLRRIFEPFFSTKTREQHTGLGLILVADIVKQHKGRIDVQSAPGVGTSFALYFPAIDVSDVDLEQ